VNSRPRNTYLKGSKAVYNFELYFKRNKALLFIAYKDYKCYNNLRLKYYYYNRLGKTDLFTLLINKLVFIILLNLYLVLNNLAN
jgi:hypothetical protein